MNLIADILVFYIGSVLYQIFYEQTDPVSAIFWLPLGVLSRLGSLIGVVDPTLGSQVSALESKLAGLEPVVSSQYSALQSRIASLEATVKALLPSSSTPATPAPPNPAPVAPTPAPPAQT